MGKVRRSFLGQMADGRKFLLLFRTARKGMRVKKRSTLRNVAELLPGVTFESMWQANTNLPSASGSRVAIKFRNCFGPRTVFFAVNSSISTFQPKVPK